MRTLIRVLAALGVGVAALFAAGTGTSHAGLDNQLSLVDGQGRTPTIQQWDTFLNGVYPLDRNRLTREGFEGGGRGVQRPRHRHGAAGGVLLRTLARLISSTGDSVTTYGEPWNMN